MRKLIVAGSLCLAACKSGDVAGPPEPVVQVRIVTPKTELIVGQQIQLAATPLNSTGGALSGRTAVWTSSSEAVAKVNAAGLVTGVAPGTAAITAVAGVASGSVTMRIVAVPIATISIAPVLSPVGAATQITLVATAKDSAGAVLTGRAFTWSSSDQSIARVSQDGVVTGLAPGSATINASQDGKSASTLVTVIPGAPRSLTVQNAGNVFVGGTRQLTVTGRDVLGNLIANPTLAWGSSDQTALSVNTAGVLTGLKSGIDVTIGVISGGVAETVVSRAVRGVSIGSGDAHSCVLLDIGSVECWGMNTNGELGVPSVPGDLSLLPLEVTGGVRFISLSVGSSHTCGLTSDGTAYCWGAADQLQLGNGSSSAKATPVKVTTDARFSQIAAGRYHTCAIQGNGELYCWGGSGAQLPAKVPTDVRFTSIASGEGQSCGVDVTGVLYCWWAAFTFPGGEVRPFVADKNFKSVSMTRNVNCALTVDGKVYCWGFAQFMSPLKQTSIPQEVPTQLRFKSIATAVERLCGLASGSGKAYCIGAGVNGELGDGLVHTTTDFVPVSPGISGVTELAAISAGGQVACGLTPAGTPFCWGKGIRLGNGSLADQFSPVIVGQPQ